MGLAVQAGHRTKGRGEIKDKSLVCSICKRAGHDDKNCFQSLTHAQKRNILLQIAMMILGVLMSGGCQ
jgi:hypothetical protein